MHDAIRKLLPPRLPEDADSKEVRAREVLWAKNDNHKTIAGSLAIARRSMDTEPDSWDRDPALIGTPDRPGEGKTGMIDLENGRADQSVWNYKITKSVSCNLDNNKDPDKWLEFLCRATGENHELITFLQIVCGYCLTGLCSEEKLYFITGIPGTGKSTFIEVIKAIFNDYAMSVDINNLVGDSRDHLEWLANTAGKRLIIAREPEPGKKWKTDVLNGLISGESMAARFMYKNSFDFLPMSKILITGNHKPRIASLEDGIVRRLQVIEFNHAIPENEQDPMLKHKLLKEKEQILAWMVEGAKRYYEEYHGKQKIDPPDCVKDATREYIAEEDIVGKFIEECCDIQDRHATEFPSAIYKAYQDWSERNGYKPKTSRGLMIILGKRNYPAEKIPSRRKTNGKNEKKRIGLRVLSSVSNS